MQQTIRELSGEATKTLGKLFTPLYPCHRGVNLVEVSRLWRSAAGKVTVGLASHQPCITDFSGLTTYRLKAYERKMRSPSMFQWSMTSFIFTSSWGWLCKMFLSWLDGLPDTKQVNYSLHFYHFFIR